MIEVMSFKVSGMVESSPISFWGVFLTILEADDPWLHFFDVCAALAD